VNIQQIINPDLLNEGGQLPKTPSALGINSKSGMSVRGPMLFEDAENMK
jgi:hypothetical protein